MFQRFNHRGGHYVLLVLVCGGLFLPNLGVPSLWDVDEGHNAEAAREMSESGNWVVPCFNFNMRTDKPALLYWLQLGAYHVFGVNEFAARLPSALAALLAVLAVYEFGRRLFDPATGLLAGVVLSSTLLFCAIAHFANPDALLNAATILTLFCCWNSLARGGPGWDSAAGLSAALAVLAKGPVGIVLPLAVLVLHLCWAGDWRRLFDRRALFGWVVFYLVALPWYVWVAVDTKAQWVKDFILHHNVERALEPMEGHGGSLLYHVGSFLIGFAPWSVFLGPALWYATRGSYGDTLSGNGAEMGKQIPTRYRFLCCWVGVYFVFFSLCGTKLPNYILPIYPPFALLTARYLERWRRGSIEPPVWLTRICLLSLALIGIGVGVGLLIASGRVGVSLTRGRTLPGLDDGVLIGLVPLLGAVAAFGCLARGRRTSFVFVISSSALLFVGLLAGWAAPAIDVHKAPRSLALAYQAQQSEQEIRVGCFDYYQPSLVFYCRREVLRLQTETQAKEFLRTALPVYLFVSATGWEQLEATVKSPYRILDRHRDLYRNCDVLVVTNR